MRRTAGNTRFRHLRQRVSTAVVMLVVALLVAACSSTPAKTGSGPTTGTGGPTTSPGGPGPSPFPLQSVDWATVTLGLLSCEAPGPSSPAAANVGQVSYVQPDAAHQLAVVLASCAAGAGAPPDALYVFDRATSATNAHLLQMLLPPALDRLAQSFSVTPTASADTPSALSGQSVTMQEAAYSSAPVPDCCPDLKYPVTWTWSGSSYTGSPADRAAGYPIVAAVAPPDVTAANGDTVSFTVSVANPGTVQAQDLSLFVISTAPTPCAASAECTDNGLTWVSGTPGCHYSSATTAATCSLGSLQAGASATTTVTMKVTVSIGPLTFTPEVDGQTSGGRFLPSFPTATVTVTG